MAPTNAVIAYTYSSAIWLSMQATPLLLTPNLITALLALEARRPTDLEIYFSRSLSLTLFTLALVTLVLTGALPLTTTTPPSPSLTHHSLALPTLIITTTFHAATAFYAYMHYTNSSQVAFGLSMVGSGSLAAMGIWCLLFGGEGGQRRGNNGRGRDGRQGGERGWDGGQGGERGWDGGQAEEDEGKRWEEKSRVSGWPFRNAEATRVKLENKEEKRRSKEEERREKEGQKRRGRGGGTEMEMETEIELEDMGWKKGV